ncbi:bifunctional diguanylate cyclase/phosphodiesterase [Pseudorhodoferax sp.]|uniref:bifunctional diguanylate cyclase/phosphodiesterase n=1 Tax=Pseudorhodoferax sp. TaxID=1993553 RepID=UPI002DD65CBC|nr:diguanylate cyclase [Pseudorhodoferax sp.]
MRATLVALMLAALLPALGTALFAIWQAGSSYRQASMLRLADTTRTLARSLEDDLQAKAAMLQAAVAGIGDGEVSLQEAQRWIDRLLGGQGRLVFESRPAEGGVQLSNLFSMQGQPGPRVALSMPMQQHGAGTLSLALEPAQLLNIAPQQGSTDTSLLIAVTDGTGRIVARSRDSQRFVGRPVPDWAKLKALNVPAGQFEAVTTEGLGVIFSFAELRNTPGWVVVVGEPLASFNMRWLRPLQHLAIGGGLGSLAALFVVWRLARRIVRPVQRLERNAWAVAHGTAPAPEGEAREFPIAEFESMRQSIESAQQILQQRAQTEREYAQARAASERRYRTLAQTGAVVLWRASTEGGLLSAAGWQLLTGAPEAEALGGGWRRFVHPDDDLVIDSVLMDVAQGVVRVDAEVRVRNADNQWRWVRARGAVVQTDDASTPEWVGVLEDVDERRRAHARIAHMAHHDALTGLPNRVEFRQRLESAIRLAGRGEKGAVLYIDLDRFKIVNDTLGHPVGDALLRAVTGRLRELVRESDTVARLAGDEFAIVQSRVGGPADASDLAERIVKRLCEPYELGGHRVEIGASIGIMLINSPDDDADQLLKFADLALYRAKQDGRGRHHFFDAQMDVLMQQRRHNETELRAALERGEFDLAYRPLVNVPFKNLSGVAAALIWRRPSHGVVQAAAFWPLAAELGLDGRLMAWMLARLCGDLVAHLALPKGTLDVSAMLPKAAPALAGWVADALRRSGLPAGRLELEIDERALAAGADTVMPLLRGLKETGVRIAMVRFGSDDAALGLLRRFPFDMVKLGRTVVHDLGQRKEGDAIARAVTKLCDDLGIMTAAEGVDSEAQLALLSAEYCSEVEGAMFGDAGSLAELLRAYAAQPADATTIGSSVQPPR